jgi:hypothetical protein
MYLYAKFHLEMCAPDTGDDDNRKPVKFFQENLSEYLINKMKLNISIFIHIFGCKCHFTKIWFLHPNFYNPWLAISLFILNFIPFVARNFFWVLFGI